MTSFNLSGVKREREVPLSNRSMKWADRVSSVYLPVASFAFDVTFRHKRRDLGITLGPYSVPFCGHAVGKELGQSIFMCG